MIDTVLFLGKSKSRKSIQVLPYPVYFWTVLGLALAGLADSLYLSISHYRVHTDIGYKSFCALTRAINCDTVSQSPYSIFLGLPVPVWGVIGYLFFLLLLTQVPGGKGEKVRLWPLLYLVALAFSLYSIVLAAISSFLIRSYCLMCIVSYAINFALLFYTWLVMRRFAAAGFVDELRADFRYLARRWRRFGLVFGVLAVSVAALWVWMPDYWKMQNPVPASSFSSGLTPEGHPWIGAEQAEIEIVEFTDYRCFQCRKMNYFLRGLMARYPDKIRIVHRHFPMDHQVNPLVKAPLHVGAGALAMMSIYAAEQGRFWEMHDLLFTMREEQEIGTRDLAQSVGLDPAGLARSLRDSKILRKLRDDMTAGYKLGVTGTPTYVIEGKVYDGQLPPDILSRIRN